MPTIPVPLKNDGLDVPQDLEAAFTAVYDRAQNDTSFNSGADLQLPPSAEQREWIRGVLASSAQPHS